MSDTLDSLGGHSRTRSAPSRNTLSVDTPRTFLECQTKWYAVGSRQSLGKSYVLWIYQGRHMNYDKCEAVRALAFLFFLN